MNLFPTPTELAVLMILANSPTRLYALEIIRANKKLRREGIYVVLKRLEKKKFIDHKRRIVIGQPGMPRPTYMPTAAGYYVARVARELDALVRR